MPFSPRLLLPLLLVPCLTLDARESEEAKPSPPAESAKKDSAEAAKDEAPMDIPIPEGQPVKGIKIPFYAEDGTTLQAVIQADTAQRLDEDNVQMTELRIDAHSDDGRKLFVEMPASKFNLQSRLLEGDQGVLIRREDFEITGREGEFDIRKRFGKVTGSVKMVIYSLENLE